MKQAAHDQGVTYDRMRHILSDLYRELGARNLAQAVSMLDDRCPGWRVNSTS